MATWPTSLPQSVFMDFVATRQSGMIRTSMDDGPAKQRKRFSAVSKMFKCNMILNGTQYSTFESFFESDLDFGATSFTWINPITDASATLRFTDVFTPSQLTPDADPAARLYQISMPLEVLP